MPIKRNVVFFMATIGFVSCGPQRADMQDPFLIGGLKNASQFIRTSNKWYCKVLADKQRDLATKWLADQWAPLAARTMALTLEEDRYLDSVKSALHGDAYLDKDKQHAVFTHVAMYRKNLLMTFDSIESTSSHRYLKDEVASLDRQWRLSQDSERLATDQFASAATLQQLTNDIDLAENNCIGFCDQHTMVLDGNQPFPICMSNNSRVKPGQPIEVIAGMVKSMSVERVVINGKTIRPNSDDLTMDTVIAATRPGQYEIPVSIEILKPDGSLATLSKKLRYTVEGIH